MAKIRNTLKPLEYWKWKAVILEMQLAKAKLELKENEVKLMSKDIEINQLKMKVFSGVVVSSHQKAYEQASSEYFKHKKHLESVIGQTLDNKVIDEITLEVSNLEME